MTNDYFQTACGYMSNQRDQSMAQTNTSSNIRQRIQHSIPIYN